MDAEANVPQAEIQSLVQLGEQLRHALLKVIRSSPLDGLGPIEAARILGIDKTLSSRLLAALRADDPLLALGLLPGTVPMRQFVKAARDHGASAGSVRAAQAALSAFDHELQRTFGTRTRLNAALADSLPQTRRRQLEGARQAVYRGMALIRGMSIDAVGITWIIHPGQRDPGSIDALVLASYAGIRKLRSTARIRLTGKHTFARPQAPASLLKEFCRPGKISIETTDQGQLQCYELSVDSIARDSSADVHLSESLGQIGPRRPQEVERVYAFGDVVAYPCRRLALNMLVHDSLWRGRSFSLSAFDTALRGAVQPPDPTREVDRAELDCTVSSGLANDQARRVTSIPRLYEVLEHLARPLGHSLDDFRMTTWEVVYPTYGSHVLLELDRADRA
jgi:hypothetical protein